MSAPALQARDAQVSLRGNWVLLRRAAGTTCVRWATGEVIEFAGRLEEMLWSDPSTLRGLGFDIGSAGEGTDVEPLPTLRRVLAPSGFGRLFLELTGRCNESCVHCYASSGPRVAEALSLAEVRATLDQAKSLGFESIQFTGGDPLVSAHIVDAVCHAAELGFERLEVYTNGLAFDDELARLFARHRVAMAFSLYSHEAAIHDAVTRTPGSQERTLRAISKAVAHHLETRVSVILTEHNAGDAPAVRRLVEGLGVPADRVGCDRERPVGRGAWREDVAIPAEEEALAHALPAQRTRPGLAKLAVTYTGDVVPCIFDRGVRLGSIRSSSLTALIESPIRARADRRDVEPVRGEPLACSDCHHRHAILSMLEWSAPGDGVVPLRRRREDQP